MSKKSYHVGQASAETAPPGLIQLEWENTDWWIAVEQEEA